MDVVRGLDSSLELLPGRLTRMTITKAPAAMVYPYG